MFYRKGNKTDKKRPYNIVPKKILGLNIKIVMIQTFCIIYVLNIV